MEKIKDLSRLAGKIIYELETHQEEYLEKNQENKLQSYNRDCK